MKCVISILYLCFLITVPAFCADYYVSTAGSDSNPGTQALPFATIQHAVDACPVPPSTSTVHLDASTWYESPSIPKQVSIIGDYNGPNGPGGVNSTIINGAISVTYISNTYTFIIQELSTHQITITNCASYVQIISCKISNSTGDGIHFTKWASYPAALGVWDCEIMNCLGDGIYETSGLGGAYIHDCLIHDCGGDGIYDYGPSGIMNNNIYNCQGWGIHSYGTNITNNTVNSCGNGICTHDTIMFFSNTATNNNMYGIQIDNCSPLVKDNIIQSNQSYGVYITGSLANPDLGGAQGSPGNNTISGNGTYEVYNDSPNNIYAKNNHWDSQSEGEMAGGYYNTVDVTRIWDKWEDSSKGYIMWSAPGPTKATAPSIGLLKAAFYPASNTIQTVKAR